MFQTEKLLEKHPTDCCSSTSQAPNSGKKLGYQSPLDAYNSGAKEQILYITGISVDPSKTDAIFTVDVNPDSPTYQQVVNKLNTAVNDELHHTGWNVCSSCHGDPTKQRRYLVVPAVRSGNIYIVDTIDERSPKLHKVIPAQEMLKFGLSHPHTAHCLASNEIMISCMGDTKGNGKGGFLLLDSDFNVKGRWSKDEEDKHLEYSYDYWYQPYHNAMVSSEWGEPNEFNKGFDPSKVSTKYGRKIYFWNWKERTMKQKIDLKEEDGLIPLETRFLHDPKKAHGFVGVALSSKMLHFYLNDKDNEWKTEKVIEVKPLKVENWALPNMPGLITDFLISMNDKYMYISNWLHGDIRQYNISEPSKPFLTGQVYLGGSIQKDSSVRIVEENGEKTYLNEPTIINGKRVYGGPQMIQLSLDGKRLYVTTSLYKSWDEQFYPEMMNHGSSLVKINVDSEKGGMKLDETFHVQFNKDVAGSNYFVHECRYPGGDCTSDIYLAQ